MNTTPLSGPKIASPPQTSARERAISKLTETAQQTPVLNPTSVSPEEMGAVQAPGQSTISETAPAQTPPAEATKAKDEPLSAQYAQLARKERAMRAEAQKLKAERAAFQAEQNAIKAREQTIQSENSLKDRLVKDPIAALTELGISYDQITNLMLNAPKPEEIAQKQAFDQLQAEIKALKDGQEEARKSYADQQNKAYEQAVNQIRSEAKQLISTGDEFETVRETGSIEDVVDLIKQTFDKDGVLLSVEEAAQAVEEYLVEEAFKLSKLKKIQQRLQPAAPVQQQAAPAAKQPQSMKTLTNSVGTQRPLSARERALLAFEGKLNK